MPRTADWRTHELRERGGKAVLVVRAGSSLLKGHSIHFRPIPASPRARNTALIFVFLLLSGALQLFAQRRVVQSSMVLQVRPEELLQNQNGSVKLKIRLAPGTTARLWAADSCASPAQTSQVITLSGVYSIPLSSFAPASANPSPSAMRVCLESSDGALKDSVPAEFSATGYGMPLDAATPQVAALGTSFDLPTGTVVTSQAGMTTWSNP